MLAKYFFGGSKKFLKENNKGEKLKKFTAALLTVVAVAVLFGSNTLAPKARAAMSLSSAKSVDVMKFTKDTLTNQPSDTLIKNLVNTVAGMNVNYIAVSIPMDATADYPSGSKPSPRSAENFTQAWADAIHAKGLHIIWRGTWSGIEGIYNFQKLVGGSRFPAGTAASAATDGNTTWLGKTYGYIVNHPSFFAPGDIWAPLPERTEGIFSDSTSFISLSGAGLQTNYVNFFNDLKKVSDAAFAKIGKPVTTGMSANNYTEIISTWMPKSLTDTAGYVVVDYYGNNHTPQEMDSDLRKMASQRGKPVFLQEWGDYWNVNLSQTDRTAYLQNIYGVLQKLSNDGVLAGFNYWGGWDNPGEGLLTQNGDTFSLNYRGQLLKNFFAANSSITSQTETVNPTPVPAPAPVPTPTPTPSPSPSPSVTPTPSPVPSPTPSTGLPYQAPVTCPAAATGNMAACYYAGRNFETPVLSRTDSTLNFDWGMGSPSPQAPKDNFSVRWKGKYYFSSYGTYIFTTLADDGVRIYVDGKLVINKWNDQGATTYTGTKVLSKGYHTITMEYYEHGGLSVAKMSWKKK